MNVNMDMFRSLADQLGNEVVILTPERVAQGDFGEVFGIQKADGTKASPEEIAKAMENAKQNIEDIQANLEKTQRE